MEKIRAKRNRTIMLSEDERIELRKELSMLSDNSSVDDVLDKTFNQDLFDVIDFFPKHFADLILLIIFQKILLVSSLRQQTTIAILAI